MGSCRCSCFLVLGWDHVDVVVFFWPAMGSVPDDYKCPLCGRVGNGGYALDGVGFPICTEGDFSCLWFQIMDLGFWPRQIIGNAIRKIFWFKTQLPASTWELIATFTHTGKPATLSRPLARLNIPSTPPCPAEQVVRIGEQIMCSYCEVFTLSRVGERCNTCDALLRAPAQPLKIKGNIGTVPWPAEWITVQVQKVQNVRCAENSSSSSSSAESSMPGSSSSWQYGG